MSKKWILRVGKYLIFIIFGVCLSYPSYATTNFVNQIPDFTQTDIKGIQNGNGQQFCAPVAVSNSIMWLANLKYGQAELIQKLASPNYMNTSLQNGTGTTGLLIGTDKIARELFGSYKRLEYQGWRKHSQRFSSKIKTPQLEWIKDGISRNSAVWLNIGWYEYDSFQDEYIRTGGHWVTVVGYSQDTLILHDPSPRAGKAFSNEYVQVDKLTSGILTGQKAGLPILAKGFYSLGNGMHLKSNADYAIIDGAVLFEL
ncbi:MAG: C39 family peptidase [Cyanobacteria bacterium J06621_8]